MDKVLIADGHARQALALAKAFHKLGCSVSAICESGLDVCALSRYVDKVIKDKRIHERPDLRVALLKKEVSEEQYTIVVACSDVTAEQIAIHKSELEAFTKVSVVDKEKFYLAFDKMETMRLCMDNGIPCPKTYLDVQTLEELKKKKIAYPVIIKPRKGYGAIGFHKFDDEYALMSYLDKHEDEIKYLIIQEYIPQTDIQYEAAMFVDQENKIKSAMVFEKNRWFPVHGGSSTCNTSVHDDDIVRICSKLMQAIQWRGCADIDLIRDPRDGMAKVMEINPRMSGSAKIVMLSGVNLALQLLQMAKGEEIINYENYQDGVRLRCLYTDLLWLLNSKDRFKAKPAWFDLKNTYEQVFTWDDPKPFFGFSLASLLKLKKELKKRED